MGSKQPVATDDEFNQTLSRFLALNPTQVPEAWQKLRRQIESKLKQQSGACEKPDSSRSIPGQARDRLHHSISQFLSESNAFLSSSTETMQSHIYDDVFISTSQDNVDAVLTRPSFKTRLTPEYCTSSRGESMKVQYIPGGRIPSVDLEQIFSDEDEEDDEYDDEAFIDGSDSELKESSESQFSSNEDTNHPLRLLSSSALRQATLVKNEQLNSTSGKDFQLSKLDLPDILYDRSKPEQATYSNISHRGIGKNSLQNCALRPFSEISANQYETLKFDTPKKQLPAEKSQGIYDTPEKEFSGDSKSRVYDTPMCSPNPCIKIHDQQLTLKSGAETSPGNHHIYSTIGGKTLDSKNATTITGNRKTDSGVFCVSFAEAYSSPESSTNGTNSLTQKSQNCTLDKTLTMPYAHNHTSAMTCKPYAHAIEDNQASFRRQFAGRFSLKIRRGSRDDEIGSVTVTCPRDERGYFQIPFDKLDTPKKFNTVNQKPPKAPSSKKPETSLRNRFSRLRSSIKRSFSVKK